ncbi:hypothetical protein ACCO45_001161 [Purpureocillium lilacinum]|uniref:Uncharacterized protein n=1 Tax=Purpureocillium lilacinum TaxID=33203 RepID=A0ACC4E7L4_PURLI
MIVSRSVTGVLAGAVPRRYFMRSVATVAALSCSLLSLAAQGHQNVGSTARGVPAAATLLLTITATQTTSAARSAHFWSTNGVLVGRRSSTASLAIFKKPTAAAPAGRSSSAGECEDASLTGTHCEQVCGKTKLFCEHTCQNTCHGQTPCNETAACSAKAVVSCPCGGRQQEVKCLASSSNPTPTRPEIKCDDECLRLERNRRLAAALNIDPSSHTNDHIPYSDATLKLFKENLSWAEAQEREFRVFSKSPDEVRMRYKPMSATYRQFLHLLAEDYGLESRSEDLEPYRSSFRICAEQDAWTMRQDSGDTGGGGSSSRCRCSAPSPPMLAASEPFNGFLLTSPRFGLTIEDINQAFAADFSTQPSVHFAISFLPTEEILLRATSNYSAFLSPAGMEQALTALKPRLAKTVEHVDLAGNILLCHIDANDHIGRREDLSKKDALGWSAVAGRAASRSGTATPTEEPPTRGGRKLLGLKKKKVDKEMDKPWAALGGDVEC